MKTILVYAGLLALAGCASKTHLVDRVTVVDTPIVTGEGSTQQEALRSALVSVPSGYEVEADGTKVSGCADASKTPFWSTRSQEYVCLGSAFKSSIAVLPTDLKERELILISRAAARGETKYSAVGAKPRKPLKSLIENNRDATASVIEPNASKIISVE